MPKVAREAEDVLPIDYIDDGYKKFYKERQLEYEKIVATGCCRHLRYCMRMCMPIREKVYRSKRKGIRLCRICYNTFSLMITP